MWFKSHDIIPPRETKLVFWSPEKKHHIVERIFDEDVYGKDGYVIDTFPPYWARVGTVDMTKDPDPEEAFPRQNKKWFSDVPKHEQSVNPHFESTKLSDPQI